MLQIFKASSAPRQAMIVAAIGALLCALLAILYFSFVRTSYATLFADMREADAATVVAELDRTGVEYRLENGGRTIMVPEHLLDATRLQVMGQDLPLRGAVGFELFNNSSIGLTEYAQRINLQRALQGELTRTIMSIEGVESARVHLSLAEQTVFRGDRRPPSASVSVKSRLGRRLSSATVRGIQRLVAGSVPDLRPESVAVLNELGALVSVDAPEAAPVNEETRNVERFFEARIKRALEARFPPEGVEVTVWAGIADGQVAAPPAADQAGRRNYRLRVSVAVAARSDSAREQVAMLVQDAIGFDAALGDSVTVTAAAARTAASEPWSGGWDGEAHPLPTSDPEPQARGWQWLPANAWLLLGLGLAVAAALMLRRRGAGPARLSDDQKLEFAATLQQLLTQRDAHAAPRP
jgi:flagellar M-ring protein FliF